LWLLTFPVNNINFWRRTSTVSSFLRHKDCHQILQHSVDVFTRPRTVWNEANYNLSWIWINNWSQSRPNTSQIWCELYSHAFSTHFCWICYWESIFLEYYWRIIRTLQSRSEQDGFFNDNNLHFPCSLENKPFFNIKILTWQNKSHRGWGMNNLFICFVLFPQASKPSYNFKISKIAYWHVFLATVHKAVFVLFFAGCLKCA